jgi:hypothetical protein
MKAEKKDYKKLEDSHQGRTYILIPKMKIEKDSKINNGMKGEEKY